MLTGCDTFVVLPPYTEHGFVIFGKNSDRPAPEVQEIVYVPSAEHQKGSKLLCTYIEIEQVEKTNAVVLSKPAWMWGAEMGANEFGVVVGNEAVWTKLHAAEAATERLLGMDLLRLGLERSATAYDCVKIIGELLEKYGQGGPCSEDVEMSYHNSFLIADRKEAWIMETADCVWVAAKVDGFANISNNLTIGSNYTLKSANLEKVAAQSGLWKQGQPLSFKDVFSANPSGKEMRQIKGRQLLEADCHDKKFSAMHMMSILRDEESGICMTSGGAFCTTSSQVSILPSDATVPCVHFFTGLPNPQLSGFKPFLFSTPTSVASPHTVSPVYAASIDPAKRKPRFTDKVDRRHSLYKCQQSILGDKDKIDRVLTVLRVVESNAVEEIENFLTTMRRLLSLYLQIIRLKTGWGPNTGYKIGKTFVGVQQHPLKYYAIWDRKPDEPYGLQGTNHLLPTMGKIASRLPIKFEMHRDKKYSWCSCGYSHNQPFCDGSHNRENTELRPVRYISDKDCTVWFCNCKQTKNRPFCDGSHKTLAETEEQ
ncbi:hypothetical protein M513_05046 [Trichuris suis]|uniref:Iron-binding zinc finger CDGSH type domain-containing protein n=1 Tax=Trichuris suis TaxID=68888 RepID=A0A085M9Y1_9BILA|nr:hypothetical protein M513_05046 [Trichuris suis]